MFPACCTSSYRSITEQPRLVSSLKNISTFLSSSNARISNSQSKLKSTAKTLRITTTRSKKSAYIARNTCGERAGRCGARRASGRRTWAHPSNCSNPTNEKLRIHHHHRRIRVLVGYKGKKEDEERSMGPEHDAWRTRCAGCRRCLRPAISLRLRRRRRSSSSGWSPTTRQWIEWGFALAGSWTLCERERERTWDLMVNTKILVFRAVKLKFLKTL